MAVRKVLVVDDSQTELVNLKRIVSGAGCTVISASSGKECLSKARDEKPDLIFMDIIMDEMDGYHACREIKKDPATQEIPVIFVTSKSQKADHLWAERQGGKAVIVKPYTDDQILAVLKSFN